MEYPRLDCPRIADSSAGIGLIVTNHPDQLADECNACSRSYHPNVLGIIGTVLDSINASTNYHHVTNLH